MPVSSLDHGLTLNHDNGIGCGICRGKNTIVAVELIKWHVEQASDHALDPDLLHLSEQYLTFSQSRCHFLRHSNSRPQVEHTLGGYPPLVLAIRGITLITSN